MLRAAFFAIITSGFLVGSVWAQGGSSLPTAFTKGSEYTVNYDDWNLILSATVLDVGFSERRAAGRSSKRSTTSRIKHGNNSVTAYEGNRIFFGELNEEHIDSLLAIRRDLEAVNDFVPLEQFPRMEQLAYWLNLHNVAVVYELATAYPVKKLKGFHRAVWGKKTMTVAGVPVSIRDIEEHVVANWNTPYVLYGFFMGTVGGPNIRTEAFTGENVVASLQNNALQFVNSLRGFRLWSGRGRVSDHYEIGARYFPNFEDDIKSHLISLARPDTRRDLEKAKSFQLKNYDWGIADMDDGDRYQGPSFNTSSAALAWFIETPNPQGPGVFGGGAANVGVLDSIGSDPNVTGGAVSGKISPQTRALLRAMKIRNQRRKREGVVTIEEFVDGEGGRVTTNKDASQ